MQRLHKAMFGAGVMLLVALPVATRAIDIGPEQTQVISQNCIAAQGSLQRLQYSDAATRVNRGYVYESLLNNLMTPMNSRLAANGYSKEAAALSSITDRYQNELRKFKQLYETYDDNVSQVIKLRCQERTATFYEGVRGLQEKRLKISETVKSLDVLTEEYYKAVKQAQKQVAD